MSFLMFLDSGDDPASAFAGTYDPVLVGLSLLVASLGSLGAFELADRIKTAQGRSDRFMWLGAGALAMGSGVWAMHFTGMLAFSLPIKVAYELLTTLLSMIPAIFAGGVALTIMSRPKLHKTQLLIGGILMGSGVGLMHHSGMMAMRMDAVMRHDPVLFTASLVVAVLLATAALSIRSLTSDGTSRLYLHWTKFGSALVMGLAISGMHYTAMTAVYFLPAEGPATDVVALNPRYLAITAGLVTIGLIALTNLASVVGRRFETTTLLEKEIVERNRAEIALKESEAKFRDIAEIAGDWIWEMDSELRFCLLSKRFFDLFPVTSKDIIGKTRKDFAGAAADDEIWRPHLDDLANHRPFRNFEYPAHMPDGSIRHIVISGKPAFTEEGVFTGYRGTGTDKTSEVEARQALQESERQFRDLIEGSIQGVYIHMDWEIVFANQALADIFGYERHEEILALGRVEPLIAEDERERLWGYRLARGKGEFAPEIYEAKGLRKDGSVFWAEFRVKPVAWQGKTALQTVVVDIDERKTAQESLQEQNTKLHERDRALIEQNERFNAALDNMTQGLCMFDAEQRLIVCNSRYADLYGLSAELVKPGTTLRQIVEHRIANGIFAGATPKAYIDERMKWVAGDTPSSKTQELSDGRTIAITYQPMSGGGWLTTHEDITERRRIAARIAHMAHHDAMTDLPNRVLLRERIEEALKRARRGDDFAVLCLDLDRFKGVNDTFGHPVGDELLKAVAQRLRGCVREIDTIARLGGDEFAIVQVSAAQPAGAMALAGRICEVVGSPFDVDDHQIHVDASIGIAVAPNDGDETDRLLNNADLALYRAKSDGRGTYRFFEAEMNARMKARRAMELELRKALGNGEFELYYQPLVNLEENRVSGAEALLRWHHPGCGLVPPSEFIPVAEEIGVIIPLGEWVLRQACAEAATWPEGIKVAVNLSPAQFRCGSLVQTVISALAASGLPASRVELEITESLLLQDDKGTLATLYKLRDLGVRISLDDFGTGYSSLSYLRSFPFDKIKIDRSFVSGLTDGEDAVSIVRSITSLAKSLGMVTTAEGVENEEQLEIIRAEGCDEVQGYLFSPPRPAKQISQLFMRDIERVENVA